MLLASLARREHSEPSRLAECTYSRPTISGKNQDLSAVGTLAFACATLSEAREEMVEFKDKIKNLNPDNLEIK